MNGWFVVAFVAFVAFVAAEWIALWLAFRVGLVRGRRAGYRQARTWWKGLLDTERSNCQRTIAAQRERHEREGLTVLFGPNVIGRPSKSRLN